MSLFGCGSLALHDRVVSCCFCYTSYSRVHDTIALIRKTPLSNRVGHGQRGQNKFHWVLLRIAVCVEPFQIIHKHTPWSMEPLFLSLLLYFDLIMFWELLFSPRNDRQSQFKRKEGKEDEESKRGATVFLLREKLQGFEIAIDLSSLNLKCQQSQPRQRKRHVYLNLYIRETDSIRVPTIGYYIHYRRGKLAGIELYKMFEPRCSSPCLRCCIC